MRKLMKKRPILMAFLFPLLMILFCGVLESLTLGMIGDREVCFSFVRIAAALLLLVFFTEDRHVFRREIGKSGRDIRLLLPIVLVVAYNLVFKSMKGAEIASLGTALLFSLAPGLYEEVLYRRIVLAGLWRHFCEKKKGLWPAVILSAASFAWIHITNLQVQGLETTVIQISYAMVFGMFFGAYFLKTRNLPFLVAAHWLVDFSSEILQTTQNAWTAAELAALAALLAVMLVGSVRMMKGTEQGSAAVTEGEKS